jgi:hypothetical protein
MWSTTDTYASEVERIDLGPSNQQSATIDLNSAKLTAVLECDRFLLSVESKNYVQQLYIIVGNLQQNSCDDVAPKTIEEHIQLYEISSTQSFSCTTNIARPYVIVRKHTHLHLHFQVSENPFKSNLATAPH